MSTRELLCLPGQLVTAVIDGALLPDLPQKLFIASPAIAQCLLGENQEPAVLRMAPWFTAFAPDSTFAVWLSARMGESPCGMASVTGDLAAQPGLYAALMPLVLIADEDSQPQLLRWWDARARSQLQDAGGAELFTDVDALLPGALYAEPPLPLTFRNAEPGTD